MNHIDFETKSDRELLILVAQKTNEIVDHLATLNNTVGRHDREISGLAGKLKGMCNPAAGTFDKSKPFGIKWQTLSIIIAIVAGIIGGIGKGFGWW